MRNLKSMVAFLVVAAMLFASFTTFAYGDVAADADYASAVEVLSALEILKGDDKGNFNPDNTITRAESAAVIVRLLGFEEAAAGAAGATQFVDVAADHWGSGYINMAAQSGIIAGYGDGNFGPEDAVTYEQFVKMLVCALGYEPQALTKGTYPTGYLIAAKEMKLTNGVAGAAGQEAARSVVAQLAFNALDIPLMEQKGWGSDISYVVRNGSTAAEGIFKTLLTDKLAVYKVEGTVTANLAKPAEATFTVTEDTDFNKDVNKDLYYVSGLTPAMTQPTANVLVKESGAEKMGLLDTVAYLKKSEDKKNYYDVLAIVPQEDQELLTIDVADLTATSAIAVSTITYNGVANTPALKIEYKDADGEKQDVTLVNTATGATQVAIATNGTSALTSSFALPQAGTITLLLADDTDYATKMAVESYYVAVVDSVNEKKARILLKNSMPSINLDTEADEDLVYSIVDTEGNEVAIADLEEWNVLNVKVSGKKTEIIVSTASVEGKVTKQAGAKYTIGGETYESHIALTIGDESIHYIDAFGKIAAKDVIATGAKNYAIITKVIYDDITEVYNVSVIGKDGAKTYTLAEKVAVDGAPSVDADATFLATLTTKLGSAYTATAGGKKLDLTLGAYAQGAAANLKKGAAVIKVNSNDEITAMDFRDAAAETAVDVNASGDATAKYVASTADLGADILASDVVVFNIPDDASAKASDITVGDISALTDGNKYAYVVLDRDDSTLRKALAIMLVKGGADENIKAPIAIVTAVAQSKDEEENDIVEYTVLTNGEEATIIQLGTTASYQIGDILLVATDVKGYVDTTKTKELAARNGSIGTTNNAFVAGAHLASVDTAGNDRKFFIGYVKYMDGSKVSLTATAANTGATAVNFNLAEVTEAYSFDLNKDLEDAFAVADAFDLEPSFKDNGGTQHVGQYAFVALDEDNNLVSIVIVNAGKDNTDPTIVLP